MRIADVLRSKGSSVATVPPWTTVAELLGELAKHNIGAVVVLTPDGVAGIVSERDVESLSVLMTERRIRHVPVVDNGRLAGIVSIGDVVKRQISQLQEEQAQLEQYITQG
jgi:CBS domain-containing protein